MPRPGPSVTSGADLQPGSDSLFPSGFTGGGARPSAGSVGTSEIADGSVSGADLNLASVTAALNGTYVQRAGGTSTTAAPLPFYNARDWSGIDSTGATDATTGLQTVLTAWAAAGGDLTLPAGTYTITGNLAVTMSKPGRLHAYGAVIKVGSSFPTGATPVLSVRGSDFSIQGLTLDGNNLADRLVSLRDNSSNVRFTDCRFRNAAQQASETDLNVVGLRLEGNISNVSIDRCHFHDITAGGGGLASFARGILISDPNSAGVTTNVKVTNCTFADIKFSGISTDADGICIQNWTTNTSLLVQGCYFKNLHKRAVKVQSPGVTISNCTIENSFTGASGVNTAPDPQVYAAISVYANDCTVTGNNITGGSWLHGIEVGSISQTTQRVSVTSNRVIGSTGAAMPSSGGIRVYGDNTCSEFIIVGNYVGRFTNGVWLSTAAAGVVVSGNQINGYSVTGTSGVLIDGQSSVQPTRLAVTGNSFEALTRYGIETALVPTDMTVVGNMGGRSGFQIVSPSAMTSFSPTSRRTYAVANGGSGSTTSGDDGLYGTSLPQGGSLARVIKSTNGIAYSAIMTPDTKTGDWQTINATNGTAFTINAPTNGPSSTQTQRLTIEVFNNSGGALGTITWNAVFVFAGQTWTSPAANKRRYATFEFNGTNWICTAVAAADY